MMMIYSCSDNSPDSPKPPPRGLAGSPQRMPEGQYSPQQTSPSRPSSLAVMGAPPTSSQPIPVPSQVQAYQQMQRSLSSPGSASNNLAAMSRQHGATVPANVSPYFNLQTIFLLPHSSKFWKFSIL